MSTYNLHPLNRLIIVWYLLMPIILSTSSCRNSEVESRDDSLEQSVNQDRDTESSAVYDVEAFVQFNLPNSLLEISGLTMSTQDGVLYTVNDEKAILFKISTEGKILDEYDFGKNGDYEGIEFVGNKIYILKSNGKIIKYDLLNKEKIETYSNKLSLSNDTEGLAYDNVTNALLIACKGSPNLKNNDKHKKSKSVYAFSLDKEELLSEPFLNITDQQLEDYVKGILPNSLSKKERKSKVRRTTEFAPSAIAINPIDGLVYLLSTHGKLMIAVDRNANIQNLYFLEDSVYRQPEGLCFDKTGNMYISNEGRALKSNLLRIKVPAKL